MQAGPQLAALSDPTRRSLFELVRVRPRAVGELAEVLPVSRPAVSQHLKVLLEAGLVAVSRKGTRRIYGPDRRGLEDLRSWVEAQWDEVLDRFTDAAEEEKQMQKISEQLPAVVKSRRVPIGVEEAFELFTERIETWWPMTTHSITERADAGVVFEGRVGGRVLEIAPDGTEYSWADVLAWSPPHRFVLSWHPNPEPIAASTLEVRFTPTEGGSEVLLEHRGWEEFGEEGEELRAGYESGWDVVLTPFEDASTIPSSVAT